MPERTIFHYEVLERLGEGGMGVVYKARDTLLDRHVAIKVIRPEYAADPAARERFRREAVSAAAVDHPFLCKVFEIGENAGTLFIVMEFIAGETLHSRLSRGPLDTPGAVRIASEIAEALEEAHASNLVHRDLKPANVMLTTQGRVKVMDFGLAKRIAAPHGATPPDGNTLTIAEPQLTSPGTAVGTPDYMSPEQVRGEAFDHRSDLFSFGILLCELLHGTHPFRKAARVDTLSAILRDPPSIHTASGAEVPAGLTVVVRRLLAKRPEDRYPSMREVREDLARLSPTIEENPRPAESRIPVVGRDAERAELRRLLDAALAGKGGMAMISGEPGIGKTHLTEAALADAARRGFYTVVGHCYEMEGAPPFVPFIEHLEFNLRFAPREGFRRALGDAAGEIARLLPELRRVYPDIPPPVDLPPEMQRRYLFNAYREFAERSAAVTPFVAVFEDLHWADAPTLQLLQHLAQSAASMPILLIGTYRDVELDVGRPFAKTLESLLRQKLATRISLRRLGVDGVESMLAALSGQPPPPSLARVVFDETEGNPFFVEEVFRHLSEEGKLLDTNGAWLADLRVDQLEVPEGVRLVLGRRLGCLSPDARRILTSAAVIGRSFSLTLLEELESANPDAALDAVEAAERAHLVQPDAPGRDPRYRFVHELVRQTLNDSLSLPRRQRLHARVAAAIEAVYRGALDKHVPAIAHHMYQAGTAVEIERVVGYLLLAARQAAAASANEESIEHLDRAFGLMEDERSVRAAEAHELRALVERSLHHSREAIDHYELAMTLFSAAGEKTRAAEIGVPLTFLHAWRLETESAVRAADRALGLLDNTGAAVWRRLTASKAVTVSATGDIQAGAELFRELDAQPASHDDPVVLACKAHHYFHASRLAEACEVAVKAGGLFRAGDRMWDEADVSWVYPFVSLAMNQADLDDVEELIREWIARAERVGHRNAAALWRDLRTIRTALRGDLVTAERLAIDAQRFSRSFTNNWGFVEEIHLASVLLMRGKCAEASSIVARAAEAQPRNHLDGWAPCLRFAAEAAAGSPAALERYRAVAGCFTSSPESTLCGAWYALPNVAAGLGMIGAHGEAASLRPLAEAGVERRYFCPALSPSYPTAAGIAAAAAGDFARAAQHHQAAMTTSNDPRFALTAPIARFWYAEMFRLRNQPGDSAQARDLYAEAARLAESIGLAVYARLARERSE